MKLSYRGSNYDSSVTYAVIDRQMTGQYRGSSYQIRPYATNPQITRKLKYRGITYILGGANPGSSTDSVTFWKPAIA